MLAFVFTSTAGIAAIITVLSGLWGVYKYFFPTKAAKTPTEEEIQQARKERDELKNHIDDSISATAGSDPNTGSVRGSDADSQRNSAIGQRSRFGTKA